MNEQAFWEGFIKVSRAYGVDPRALAKFANENALAMPKVQRGAGVFDKSGPQSGSRVATSNTDPNLPIAGAPGTNPDLDNAFNAEMARQRKAKGVDEQGRQLPWNQR